MADSEFIELSLDDARTRMGKSIEAFKRDLAGIHGPTVAPVFSDDGQSLFGVQMVVRRVDMIRVIDHLRSLGGSGISVSQADYVFRETCESYEALLVKLAYQDARQ